MTQTRLLGSLVLAVGFVVAGAAHATTIEFTPSSSSPNSTTVANAAAYGSSTGVSVGYSARTYSYSSGYAKLDGGTGAAIYSTNTGADGSYELSITFTADAGYTVTLDNFQLAQFRSYTDAVNIFVTGGNTAYSLSGEVPSNTTYTMYSPGVTGTTLTLNITNLYDVGINSINYTATPLAVAATPELDALGYGLAWVCGDGSPQDFREVEGPK